MDWYADEDLRFLIRKAVEFQMTATGRMEATTDGDLRANGRVYWLVLDIKPAKRSIGFIDTEKHAILLRLAAPSKLRGAESYLEGLADTVLRGKLAPLSIADIASVVAPPLDTRTGKKKFATTHT